MKNTAHIVLAGAVLVACSSAARAQGPGAAPCERLRSLTLNGARITAAESVAEGAFVPPGPPNAARFADLPAFCRVTALASRAGDTDVKIEVWLPAADKWTGEFQPAASGFAGGTIGYREMRTIAARGIATANTNRGHDGGGPWKPADMSAVPYHLMAEHAKAIVAAFYNRPPALDVHERMRRVRLTRCVDAHPARACRPGRGRRGGDHLPADASRRVADVDLPGDSRQRSQLHPAVEIPVAAPGGSRCLRRQGRREGRRHHRPAPVPVRIRPC